MAQDRAAQRPASRRANMSETCQCSPTHSPVRTPNPNHAVGSVDQDGSGYRIQARSRCRVTRLTLAPIRSKVPKSYRPAVPSLLSAFTPFYIGVETSQSGADRLHRCSAAHCARDWGRRAMFSSRFSMVLGIDRAQDPQNSSAQLWTTNNQRPTLHPLHESQDATLAFSSLIAGLRRNPHGTKSSRASKT